MLLNSSYTGAYLELSETRPTHHDDFASAQRLWRIRQ